MPTRIADEAYQTFSKWLEHIESDSAVNEDTTRMRFIDTIIFDILGWDKKSVETEPYIETEGYADYIFRVKGGSTLILEAKRVGVPFTLPNTHSYPPRAVPFRLIAEQCPAALEAMSQAVKYAIVVGARYTAISNGRQWLLMLTLVEGIQLKDRGVVVFESFDAIRNRFSLFWDCFSPLMIQTNKPYAALLDARRRPAPAKLAMSIEGYPVGRENSGIRNQHATGIQYIWEEVNASDNLLVFFKECYVEPVGHEKNRGLATQLLSDRAAKDLAEYERLSASEVPDLVKGGPIGERPIVLLGRIGHGKSTFIRYLKTVAAAKALENYIQIDINFLDLPRTIAEVAKYVYSEVSGQLDQKYSIDIADDAVVRAALHGPLLAFRNTPRAKLYLENSNTNAFKEAEVSFLEKETAETHAYLKRVLKHLQGGRRKSIAIFFDNLDKRSDLQEEAFLIASAIAREWSAMTFICLRPGTFYKSRDSGVLDSIAPRLIEVHSPPTGLFLKRRFDFASAIASGEKLPPRGHQALAKSIAQDGTELSQLFASLSASVQKDRAITSLFEAVANGNLRELLQHVGSTITSWHLNTVEMTKIIRDEGVFYLSHHQAMRAMLYGNSIYFDPELSPFINLFDLKFADPVEHFLRPLCLFLLDDLNAKSISRGFMLFSDLVAKATAYSFTEDQIEETLMLLFAKRLVEDDSFSEQWPGVGLSLRLSLLGRYHVAELMSRFEYIDAVVVDTPIVDVSTSAQIRTVTSLQDRLLRGRAFLRYLNSSADGLHGTPFYSHWDRVHQKLAGEMTDIESHLSSKT